MTERHLSCAEGTEVEPLSSAITTKRERERERERERMKIRVGGQGWNGGKGEKKGVE